MHLQAFGRRCREREVAIFVKNDEAAIGIKKTRPSQAAVTPRDLPGLDVNGSKWRRAEIAARTEDQIADANAVAEMHTHQTMRPNLLNRCFVAIACELEDTTSAAVSRRNEEQIVFTPHRGAGVQAEICRVRMAPQ